jgi:hypothetical protein
VGDPGAGRASYRRADLSPRENDGKLSQKKSKGKGQISKGKSISATLLPFDICLLISLALATILTLDHLQCAAITTDSYRFLGSSRSFHGINFRNKNHQTFLRKPSRRGVCRKRRR